MFNHAPEDYICPFCLIIRKVENQHVLTLQNDIIFRNDRVTAFVSTLQKINNPGNVLVVPNQHYENIYALPAQYAVEIQFASRMIALVMKDVFRCDGISTRQHNEPSGGQDVWHYHVHITPRFKDDNFYGASHYFMIEEEREQLVETLRIGLGKFSENDRDWLLNKNIPPNLRP